MQKGCVPDISPMKKRCKFKANSDGKKFNLNSLNEMQCQTITEEAGCVHESLGTAVIYSGIEIIEWTEGKRGSEGHSWGSLFLISAFAGPSTPLSPLLTSPEKKVFS